MNGPLFRLIINIFLTTVNYFQLMWKFFVEILFFEEISLFFFFKAAANRFSVCHSKAWHRLFGMKESCWQVDCRKTVSRAWTLLFYNVRCILDEEKGRILRSLTIEVMVVPAPVSWSLKRNIFKSFFISRKQGNIKKITFPFPFEMYKYCFPQGSSLRLNTEKS